MSRALLILFGVLASIVSRTASADVTPYSRLPGDAGNLDYVAVTVNSVPVDTTMTEMNVGYAQFAFSGKATVQITTAEPIKTLDLSPHRAGIKATANGNVLTFELDRPQKLHLRVNSLSRFFLFADAPEINPPKPGDANVHSLAELGVNSDSDLPQTSALQSAIDQVAAKGGTLYVPSGVYRSGKIYLRSGLNLYLAPGAIIKGTARLEDYPKTDGSAQQVHLFEAENVRIFGRGVIDGNGQALRRANNNATPSKAKLITTLRSKNIVIEDVMLRGAGVWCVHMVESSDIRISNIKLISMTRAEAPPGADAEGTFYAGNADGFDPDNSSRVLIENNFISCDDDAIAVKLRNGSVRRDMSDITFRGNVIWTTCSALKIGTEVHDRTLSNVVFENNDIIHADVGIAVWCWRGGTVDGAKWINNHFEAIGVLKNESPHKKETNIRITIRNVENSGGGNVRDLLIKDNTFERFSPNDALIQGLDPDHMVNGVRIINLVVAGRKRVDADDARLTVSQHTQNVVFD